jgi:single-stranded-DNA-specific exonuclease
MKNNWKIVDPKEQYDNQDSITDKILKIRGIVDKERLVHPREDDINNPYHLSNMKSAVSTILNAINNKLSIGIYADIDCDGVTSATLMYKYLKNYEIDAQLLYHQRKLGHGVIVDNAPKELDLLIIVDSSSNNVNECKELSPHMDIVILDHHPFSVENKYATIVNPQYNNYPNKFLSGTGVVYQTCRAIDGATSNYFADQYIDLCAIGLISDMMYVLEPETRMLIQKGLYKIHNDCDVNLNAILKHLKKDYKPTTTDIAYYLVPFINSIIRLGKIEDILEILTSSDKDKIKKLIKSCSEINDKRKVVQGDLIEKIDNMVDLSHKIIIVDVSEFESPSTMNGLIANNVAQKYQKPTLIVSFDKETSVLSGSGRNYGSSFDFKNLLLETKLFEMVEGHPNSFGVEFLPENLNKIYESIDKSFEDIEQNYTIEADMLLDIDDITWEILYEIQRLSFITGEGFREPLFIIKGLFVEDVKIMKDIHIKFNSDELECIKFNVTPEEISNISDAAFVDVLGSIGINSWYNFGTKTVIKSKQILIKDIEVY